MLKDDIFQPNIYLSSAMAQPDWIWLVRPNMRPEPNPNLNIFSSSIDPARLMQHIPTSHIWPLQISLNIIYEQYIHGHQQVAQS